MSGGGARPACAPDSDLSGGCIPARGKQASRPVCRRGAGSDFSGTASASDDGMRRIRSRCPGRAAQDVVWPRVTTLLRLHVEPLPDTAGRGSAVEHAGRYGKSAVAADKSRTAAPRASGRNTGSPRQGAVSICRAVSGFRSWRCAEAPGGNVSTELRNARWPVDRELRVLLRYRRGSPVWSRPRTFLRPAASRQEA